MCVCVCARARFRECVRAYMRAGGRAVVRVCVRGIIYCLDLICCFINAAYNLYVAVD